MKKLIKIFFKTWYKIILFVENRFDKNFLAADVPLANVVSHQNWRNYLYRIGNKQGMRILEIGSREVTGPSNARNKFDQAEYLGFDFYPGKNVDVLGDAHRLS